MAERRPRDAAAGDGGRSRPEEPPCRTHPAPEWPLGVQAVPAHPQVDAVLAWLVVEADSPNAVHVHPLNAVLTWTPLLGEHLLLTEP
jgi:hypothetical protein